MLRKRRFLLVAVSAGALLVSGCQAIANVDPPTTTTRTVTGKVLDGSTGTPVAGAVVEFAGHSATSGTDGSYSLDLEQGSGTATGVLSLHADGYVANLFDGVTVDASSDSTAIWQLQKINVSGVPAHTINFRIFELQSNPLSETEIPDRTPIVVYVLNESGAVVHWSGMYSGGYSFSGIGGQSCVVSVYVNLEAATGMHSLNFVASNIALTAASLDMTLTEDPVSEQTITLTGNAPGNNATLFFSLPNAYLHATEVTLDEGAQATVHLSNPDGYAGFWAEKKGQLAWAGTAIGPIGSSVILPAPPSPGAATPPDSGTVAYTSGTLSVQPGTGVDGYTFTMTEDSKLVAVASSAETSVTLPTWMQNQLAGMTLALGVSANISDGPIPDMSTMALIAKNGGIGPSVSMVILTDAVMN